jgi:hypothetical protein
MPTNPKSIKCVGTNYAMELPRYHCHWDFMPSWILRHVDDMYVFVYYYLFCILLYYYFSPPLFLCRRPSSSSSSAAVFWLHTNTHTHTRIHSPMDLFFVVVFHSISLHLSLAPQPSNSSCIRLPLL